MGVDRCGWDVFGDAVVESDFPAFGVNDSVVVGADQDSVLEVGAGSVAPGFAGVVSDAP